jgi:hypothetical protein
MTSGEYITYFLILSVLGIFPVWEFVQLYRRRQGNKSALTMSQYVVKRARAGSKFWKVFILAFPVFILLIAIWLVFHWSGPCINFGILCSIDV